MKICHIITHFDMGGAERVAANIAISHTSGMEYHMVEVLKTKGQFRNDFIEELQKGGVKVHQSFISNSKIGIVCFPFWFLFTMIRIRPNILHSHTEIPDFALYLWYSIFGWIFPRLKLVRTIHNTELWSSWIQFGVRVEKLFLKKNANVAISESTKRNYVQMYGETPIIIYNGVSETPQKKFEGIVEGKINILFAGRLEYQKGVDELVAVVTALKKPGKFVFHIVGAGSLKEKVDVLKSLQSVRLYDKIYGLSAYLHSFDYLFMPSNFEGLALMSIEASMAKLPTIINRCPGLKDTMPQNWPLAVSNNSVADYLKIFDSLNSVDGRTLGNRAYEYAQKHFTVREMQLKYEEVYKT